MMTVEVKINDKPIITMQAINVEGEPNGVCTYDVLGWDSLGPMNFTLKHDRKDGAAELAIKMLEMLQ